MSRGVGRKCGLDPTLLWLWCRPAATAPIRPLAWELPYAAGVALKSKNKKTNSKTPKLNVQCCLALPTAEWTEGGADAPEGLGLAPPNVQVVLSSKTNSCGGSTSLPRSTRKKCPGHQAFVRVYDNRRRLPLKGE